ncbi:hypothetical protein GCM10023194_79460 [Planotetraspora phitsanulokensis]|uniref:Uncharacterized protein n=1 Tax=Planotetraspora phitsanulokensis TaxID=575192 RepID=A0A8J3UBD4_9ACTN|nr:hypothetical protein [Planotetraspora phitsanulokensis]GII41725.1 hypothetical protein Pph01_67280 [Planotetraspora phitsanulokensis]
MEAVKAPKVKKAKKGKKSKKFATKNAPVTEVPSTIGTKVIPVPQVIFQAA